MRIDVALPLPGSRTYTYAAPEHLADLLRPGIRVLVPLQKRILVGFVWGKGNPEVPEEKLRPLHAVLDEEPLISADILRLCRWIAEYYFSSPGESLALALPSVFLKPAEPTLSLTPQGLFSAPEQDGLYQELLDRQSLPLSHLQADAARWMTARRLVRDGRAILSQPRLGVRRQVPMYVLPAAPMDQLLQACGRSPKRRDVLGLLASENRPFSPIEITQVVGAGPALVQDMARRRILQKVLQDRPYSMDAHCMPVPAAGPALHPPTPDQKIACEAICAALREKRFAPFLLQGVTGSGKTEVYLRAISEAVLQGGRALYLVPEIGLTPVAASQLESLFPGKVSVFHSGLNEGERLQEFHRIRRGEVDVVIGARSALFLPLDALRLIVVDEDQDTAYKQEDSPRYHARDAAVVRAREAGAAVLLGSATPSMESWANGEKGKYALLTLRTRVEERPLPHITIVDIRGEKPEPGEHGRVLFSAPLLAALGKTFASGSQAILLVNRRGYAPVLLCRLCGHTFPCPSCSVSHTLHRRRRALICHYCGHQEAVPSKCPACGGEVLEDIGFATEKVAEKFQARFPEVPCAVLDRDTASRRGHLADILFRFSQEKIQALIGTQMVAKGHHFPGVALVGILNADQILHFPDFRAAERLFALIVQAAGRAGRGDVPGEVCIQTTYPDHYAVRLAATQDYAAFYEKEMGFRKAFLYPPMAHIALLAIQDSSQQKARELAQEIARTIRENPAAAALRVQGPAPAPLSKIKSFYRFQVLVRSPRREPLREAMGEIALRFSLRQVLIDMDPQNLL